MNLRILLIGLTVALATRSASALVVAARVSVGTVPTLIAQNDSDSGFGPVLVKNTGADPVYLGGATVATTTGYELAASETVSIALASHEALYGIVGTGTVTVHKLENRK